MYALNFFIFLATIHLGASNVFVHLKLVKCEANEAFVYPNISCYAKSWSRNVSTSNVVVYFKKPVNTYYVSSALL